jgi:hypothetical protein
MQNVHSMQSECIYILKKHYPHYNSSHGHDPQLSWQTQ